MKIYVIAVILSLYFALCQGSSRGWECVRGFSCPMRMNRGHVECMSYNRKHCLWRGYCQSKLSIDAKDLQPLRCGPMHKTVWGSTGYENQRHWCTLIRQYFNTQNTTNQNNNTIQENDDDGIQQTDIQQLGSHDRDDDWDSDWDHDRHHNRHHGDDWDHDWHHNRHHDRDDWDHHDGHHDGDDWDHHWHHDGHGDNWDGHHNDHRKRSIRI